MCRKENAPLNFFSWHYYTADPAELSARARAIRRLLDSKGFTETECHLNEWNYLPGNSWAALDHSATGAMRQRCYEEMAGASGAAFVIASLLELQDAPVDVCNFYHGELGGFGIFTEQGVPLTVYQALRAYKGLMETPRRIQTHGAVSGKLACAAGLSADGREASFLVSNFADPRSEFVLNWKGFNWTGGVTVEVRSINAGSDFSTVRSELAKDGIASLRLAMKAPSISLIRLRPANSVAKMTLSVTSPANRLVFQRNMAGSAVIPLAGACAWPGATVEGRLVDVLTHKAGDWTMMGMVRADLSFSGRAQSRGRMVLARGPHSRHGKWRPLQLSNASVSARCSLSWAIRSRMVEISIFPAPETTGSAPSLCRRATWKRSAVTSSAATRDSCPRWSEAISMTTCKPAPSGRGTYFWAAFAERVAKAQNVPVLLLKHRLWGHQPGTLGQIRARRTVRAPLRDFVDSHALHPFGTCAQEVLRGHGLEGDFGWTRVRMIGPRKTRTGFSQTTKIGSNRPAKTWVSPNWLLL